MRLSTRYMALLAAVLVAVSAGSEAMAQAGRMAYYWSKGWGDFGTDVARSVAVDGAGNVIVVGSFEGTVNLGGGDLTSAGDEDIFIAKFNQYGTHLWSMSFGDTGGDQGFDVAVDAVGAIYMTGYFDGTVEFGGASLVTAGGRDAFIVKFSSTGTHMWSMSYGSGYGNDEGHSVAVDGSGNVVLAGEFGNTMNFGGFNLVSNGNSDLFLARFNTFGTLDWAESFGGAGYDSMAEVAAEKQYDTIFITGNFSGSIDLGGGALVSAGAEDIFLATYSSGGGHQWSKRFGDVDHDYGNGLTVDSAGHVILTGSFIGAVDFGGGTLAPGGGTSAIVVSYSTAGTYQWSRGVAQSFGWDVTTNADNDVLVTGSLLGTGDFGGGDLTTNGGLDVVVAWYDALGNHKWSKNYGDAVGDAGFGIAVDYNGNPTVVGETGGTINFGGSNLGGAGGYDAFVAKWFGEIEIGALDDNGGDRGRAALMVWVKHFLDGPPHPIDPPQAPITHYSIWRAVDMLPMYPPDPIHSCPGMTAGVGLQAAPACDGWERVADIPATGNEQYQLLVPTTRDATPGDPAVHYFVVMAEDDEGGYHNSPPESVSTTDDLGAAIVAIADVPNDNGRWVSIDFTRDSEDTVAAATPVLSYEVYRSDDTPPATLPAAVSAGQGGGLHRIDGWTYVVSAPAHGDSLYSVEAPTIGDSTIAKGAYNSTFFVRATTAAPTVFFDSPAYAGYSLDNLAPAMPTGLAINAGVLSWDPSPAADFDYFTVYGSLLLDDFGNAVVVEYTTGESMDVSASGDYWFYVTATDFSGNESPYGTLAVATGASDGPRRYVLSVSNYPNPFNPATTIRYTVPAAGNVTVAIYDTHGARVATLIDGRPHAAGAYNVEWNGRSGTGVAVASGVYFARIEHTSGVRAKKIVLVK